MNRLLSLILLLSYAAPALLGHGGLHALYGVEHHCCGSLSLDHAGHHHAGEGHTHCGHIAKSCCGHSHAGANESSDSDSPAVPLDHSDEYCSLCQHVAQGQLETAFVELICTGAVVSTAPLWPMLRDSDEVATPHVPRGPPVC